MLTQTIEINLTQSKLSSIIMRSEEKGREIAFFVIDEAGDPVALEDYSVKFLMLKPDENVVYADVVSGVLTQTEQMTTSKGAGYYCIRIIDAGTVIYSGQGRVLVDDHVIDDETLNSISEVDGYIFPDDFATHAWVEEYVDEHTGSDVIANPDTAPTDTLETVTIEDTTYDIIHPAENAVGNPIEITDAAAAPMIKCVSAITGYQSGTGTPSPDNIRTIVAYTEGEIEVSDGDGNVTTHTTTYPSAIYRGSEDVVNGEVTEELICIDLGSLSWAYNANDGYFAAELPTMKTYNYDVTPSSWLCSAYSVGPTRYSANAGSVATGTIYPRTTSTYVFVKDTRYTDAVSFTAGVTGYKFVYELATTTTTPVTPTNLPIKSLNGYNHIESSTGDLDITYIKQPYESIIRSSEQADNDLIRITSAYDAASLSNTDVTINYKDYDALVIYVNDALTQCGVSSVFTKEYLEYCQTNSRSLTIFPYGTAYVSYNIQDDKLEYAGDNNQGFYIIRIDGINYRR